MADECMKPSLTDKPRKRKITGSTREKQKLMRLRSHEVGEDCLCKRFECFRTVTEDERTQLVQAFNDFTTKNAQDSFLSTLISLKPVERRRPRQDGDDITYRDHSVVYIVKVVRDGAAQDITVCQKAFCSMFGITKNRVETIRKALKTTGRPPIDGRGKHQNRPHKLDEEVKNQICNHISSFRGRSSHYCRGKTRRVYLPEDLNIQKMFQLFKELHPESAVSYETYRKIFNCDFNIGFGYPRKDTCRTCDEIRVKIKHIDQKIEEATKANSPNCASLVKEKQGLLTEKELHIRKADTFYSRKAVAKSKAKSSSEYEAIAFDYQKNLPVPNKTANDVYYKRQLTFITFCIHVLSSDTVYMYTYDETIAKKGADDVCSMLNHFIQEYLPDTVKTVTFFCDGCAGQNKNFTVFRYFHHLVHERKRLSAVTVCFPIRGHSYMECDRDMVNVDTKTDVEIPDEWRSVYRSARQKPTPFNVIKADRSMFFAFTNFLKGTCKAICPVSSPLLMTYRNSWNGSFETAVIGMPKSKVVKSALKLSYVAPIPIRKAKYDDLQALKSLCKPEHQEFFDRLDFENQSGGSADESDSSSDD